MSVSRYINQYAPRKLLPSLFRYRFPANRDRGSVYIGPGSCRYPDRRVPHLVIDIQIVMSRILEFISSGRSCILV